MLDQYVSSTGKEIAMKRFVILFGLTSLLLGVGIGAQTGSDLFSQALAKERVDGNLPEAIRLYERVVTEFASDHALASKALLQAGLCYEKLGRDEAGRSYERLIRDFGDQADAVTQARARLAVLKRAEPAAASATGGLSALPRVDAVNNLQALSPDGTKAAFMSYDKGQNLAIYDLASRQTKLLTNFDWTTNWVYSAAWSPDGRRVAYMQGSLASDPIVELRVATLDGTSASIFRNQANPGKGVVPGGWLPDGSAIAVALVRADNTSAIGLVAVGGGGFTPLRSMKWVGQYPDPPSVSPDGKLIAFADGAQGMRDIYVISRDGQTTHQITDQPADDYRPLWSPDGSHLAFLSNRNGSPALWTVVIHDGQPAGEPVRAKEGMQDVNLLGWTKRGLAYGHTVRTDDIYMVTADPASGEPSGSPRQLPFPRTGRNVAPIWSPDGHYFAFASSSPAEPDRRVVVLLPTSGGDPREFPIPTSRYSAAQAPYDLRWFGNSTGLGFSGLDSKGNGVVFRLTLATGEWKTFPLPVKTWTRIEWNADGSAYYYARQGFAGDEPGIVEHDLQSDKERVISKGIGQTAYRGLQLSPDRRSLAFRFTGPRQGFTVVDIQTGETRVVLDEALGTSRDTAVTLGGPTWSPDGRALLFTREEKQATDLRWVPVGGGEVRLVPLNADLKRLVSSGSGAVNPSLGSVVWSPDGAHLAFVVSAASFETWLLENPLR